MYGTQQTAPQPSRQIQFRFTGTASEYFRIWIVNVGLSIVTLGVYSAWAKVRNKQYFCRHTWVEDATFDYTADPIRILKGRIIVVAALGALVAAQAISPVAYGIALAALLLLTPWALVSSLAFNARNTSYRGIAFGFSGSGGEALGVYLLMIVMQLFTLGLGAPYAQWRFTQFIITRHAWGDERFEWRVRASAYYKVMGRALLMFLGLFAVIFAGMFSAFDRSGGGAGVGQAQQTMVLLSVAILYPGMFLIGAYLQARLANLTYGEIQIGSHRLTANQRARDIIKLYFTNAVAVLCTFGLAIPWAKIRLARYRAEHLSVIASGPLLVGHNPLARGSGALGDAASDLGALDLDVGL